MASIFDEMMSLVGGLDQYYLLVRSEFGRTAVVSALGSKLGIRLLTGTSVGIFQSMVQEVKLKRMLVGVPASGTFELVVQYIITRLSAHDKSPIWSSKISTTDALENAFTRNYVGGAVDGLYEFLLNCASKFESNPMHYQGRFVAIIQSSGVGKTRTIHELMQTRALGMYINIGSVGGGNSYPPRDDVPANILSGVYGSKGEYTSRCIAFFTALFTTLRNKIELELAHGNSGGATLINWSKAMCNYGSAIRKQFFEKLKVEYEAALEAIRSGNSPAFVRDEFAGEIHMTKAYLSLIYCLPDYLQRSSYDPQLVIAFDSVEMLGQTQPEFRPSYVLREIMSKIPRMSGSIWILFVSSGEGAADFSSLRPWGEELTGDTDYEKISIHGHLGGLFPPYSQFDWDQLAKPLSKIELDKAAKGDNILGFGRPLWKVLSVCGQPLDAIVETAAQLLCQSLKLESRSPDQTIAVLGQRFGLDFCFGQIGAYEIQRQAISNHLRVCLETTDNGIWQKTSYPSEPLLSCGASRLLYHPKDANAAKTNLALSLEGLVECMQAGWLVIENNTELVSRLVYLLAKDHCVRSPGFMATSNEAEELLDCRMLPVTDYLKFVFGPATLTLDVENVFGGWYINFSHWISMSGELDFEKPIQIKSWLSRHWARTCAVQCWHDQRTVDQLVPMYKNTADPEPYGECLSYILISNRTGKLAADEYPRLQTPTGGWSQPYISIITDLCQDQGEPESWLDTGDHAPSLQIYAPGVNSVTYSFLAGAELSPLQDTLRNILNIREDPRPGITFLRSRAEYGSAMGPEYVEWELRPGV